MGSGWAKFLRFCWKLLILKDPPIARTSPNFGVSVKEKVCLIGSVVFKYILKFFFADCQKGFETIRRGGRTFLQRVGRPVLLSTVLFSFSVIAGHLCRAGWWTLGLRSLYDFKDPSVVLKMTEKRKNCKGWPSYKKDVFLKDNVRLQLKFPDLKEKSQN